nr:MAG TPA: hypothetical protein [Caudoviricetes sp.]
MALSYSYHARKRGFLFAIKKTSSRSRGIVGDKCCNT